MGKEKTKLFDSSSDDSEDDLSDGEMFDVKAQFEGPAGERVGLFLILLIANL